MKKFLLALPIFGGMLFADENENNYELPIKDNMEISINTPENRLTPGISDDGSTITEYVIKDEKAEFSDDNASINEEQLREIAPKSM